VKICARIALIALWPTLSAGQPALILHSEPVTLLPLKLRSEKSSIGYTLHLQTTRGGRYVIQK